MPLEINKTDRSGFAEAVEVASKAEVVVMALGKMLSRAGKAAAR
jgi:beta-glucosidase